MEAYLIILPTMCQSCNRTCIVVNGGKNQRHAYDLDLYQKMSYIELVRDIFIYKIRPSFKLTDSFLSYCLQRHKQQDRQTDRHEYSMILVDKRQL